MKIDPNPGFKTFPLHIMINNVDVETVFAQRFGEFERAVYTVSFIGQIG